MLIVMRLQIITTKEEYLTKMVAHLIIILDVFFEMLNE
jgi:hypothetical protein